MSPYIIDAHFVKNASILMIIELNYTRRMIFCSSIKKLGINKDFDMKFSLFVVVNDKKLNENSEKLYDILNLIRYFLSACWKL